MDTVADMRSVRFHDYGPPEVLQIDSVPDPQPGPGHVLVRVDAAGIGFADVQIRAGLARSAGLDLPLPFAVGFEVAGTVVEVGPGVDPAMLDRQVVGSTTAGGYSELAVLPFTALHDRPDALDNHAALALLGQGVAAVGVFHAAAVRPGDTVLVEAAAGGVGSLLLQLAKRAGATVIATARGEEKLATATRLGADVAIDYSEPDWSDKVRAAGGGSVSVALETTGGAVSAAAFDLLTPGSGRMVIYGTTSGEPPRIDTLQVYHRGVQITGFASVALPPDRLADLLDQALTLGAAGELRPVLGRVWPLSQAAAAHRAFAERSTIGKVVLVP
jgi:NADPH2:quinone reductase